jgi:hypothetical protein
MAQRDPWHPYAPDQQFGSAAAEDQRRVEDLLVVIDALLADLPERRPRAGNRAPNRGDGVTPALAPRWDWLRTDPPEGPSTTASALEAAPWVSRG